MLSQRELVYVLAELVAFAGSRAPGWTDTAITRMLKGRNPSPRNREKNEIGYNAFVVGAYIRLIASAFADSVFRRMLLRPSSSW